ncbi:hypothetical protein M3J09_013414 [Ascochyta lentis]
MRQNFSSPALSPIPPYPAGEAQKEGKQDKLVPAALPAPLRPLPPTPRAAAPSKETRDKGAKMRKTHIRPRTAPASPERPGTAYSTRSTIRQVEPSPDSLGDALANELADGGTPAPGPSFEPFPLFDPGRVERTAEDELYTHIPSTEPGGSSSAAGLRRGGTPSGRASPRKSRSCSPQKSRSRSPRKNVVQTPTLPAHQESPASSSAYSGAETQQDGEVYPEPPDTPSPVTREQQRQAYAPLQIRRPFAAQEGGEDVKTEGYGTHVRIADYMRKMRQQRSSRSASPKKETKKPQVPASPSRTAEPSALHIVQAMAQPNAQSQIQTLSPFSRAQKQAEKEPARHTSVSRRSEASGASVASKHSIFSTPGRDEMERKKPIVEEDEGPFAKATSMQDLEQRRRRVSEVEKEGHDEGKKRICGMRCVVM